MIWNDREKKLIRLVLDPGAKEGEVANGAVMLFRSLIARGVMPDQLLGDNAREKARPEAPPWRPVKLYIFPMWGKYAGQSFDDIDPSYLRWVHNHWSGNWTARVIGDGSG
jgi:hypothetical protein